MRAVALCCAAIVAAQTSALAVQEPRPLQLLDVPFISQSELLCGGAAAAMVLRYWGERGITAESFAALVDRSASGIRTDALVADLTRRGWTATAAAGSAEAMRAELARGRPVLTLIEDRPSTYHYVVVVAAHERGVVFHDPARAPFLVMSAAEFDRRWRAADRWMAVVVPGSVTATFTVRLASRSRRPSPPVINWWPKAYAWRRPTTSKAQSGR
jgi:ABC-type bacteriocin/lantibiotic exporter with double-glycine peptidase domain